MASDTPKYDLIVVGAGVNGLGVAREAAERGLSVGLLEKTDLCAGVSAWSGRLVHGGLRYLEHGDVPLVRESLRERERLFRQAPHLVKPVDLLMPFYAKNTRPSWMIRLGMIAYDTLSFDKSVHAHRILSTRKVLSRFPGMNRQGLSGSAVFVDGQVEYAERLCVEIALAAAEAGAVLRFHSRVTDVLSENGRATGVRFIDSNGDAHVWHADVVVNAAGPWIDDVVEGGAETRGDSAPRLNGGSKGSHLIVDPFPGAPDDVVYYESQTDGRLVLVIPWMGRYLIGTTDHLFDEDPDLARADMDEADYLLGEVNALIPEAKLTLDDVLFTYSGVRPLPYAPDVAEWKIPRSHVVFDHAKTGRAGMLTVVGGKLTTFRQLGQDTVDAVVQALPTPRRLPKAKTWEGPYPGARTKNLEAFRRGFVANSPFESDTAERLFALYGTRAERLAQLVRRDPALGERFDPNSPAVAAELVLAVDEEFAETLTDVMARRVLLAFEPHHGLAGLERAAEILAAHQGWNAERQAAEMDEYREWLDHLRVPGAE